MQSEQIYKTLAIKNKMLRICIFCWIVLLTNACTSEPSQRAYQTKLYNATNQTLILQGFDSNSNVILQKSVLPSTSYDECTASLESYIGLTCQMQKLKISFSNGRGYICTVFGDNALCFPNKNVFYYNPETFTQVSPTIFQFEITQSDYENAFVLP